MLQKKQEIMMVEAETAAAKLEIQTNQKTATIRTKAQVNDVNVESMKAHDEGDATLISCFCDS